MVIGKPALPSLLPYDGKFIFHRDVVYHPLSLNIRLRLHRSSVVWWLWQNKVKLWAKASPVEVLEPSKIDHKFFVSKNLHVGVFVGTSTTVGNRHNVLQISSWKHREFPFKLRIQIVTFKHSIFHARYKHLRTSDNGVSKNCSIHVIVTVIKDKGGMLQNERLHAELLNSAVINEGLIC